MPNIILEQLQQTPVAQQRVELVERKGTGHPDSICDAVLEEISVALCREYLASFGRVLHHNIDKGLLPGEDGGRIVIPHGLGALYAYHAVKITMDEMLAD